jgi:hypothetical protein
MGLRKTANRQQAGSGLSLLQGLAMLALFGVVVTVIVCNFV